MPEVISAHRRSGPAEGAAAEILQGRVTLQTLGDRVVRTKPESKPQLARHAFDSRPGHDAFALVTAFVADFLTDLPEDVLHSATEAAIRTVQDENLTETAKKFELQDLLGQELSNEKYNALLNIVRRLPKDIEADTEEQDVAVIYDDGQADSESSGSSDSESDDNSLERTELPPMPAPEIAVDRDWLQKLIEPAGKSVRQVLAALELETNQQENELLELFEYEHLDIVKVLVLNRDRIFWLTKYHMAETGEEREQVLADIEAAGMSHLLHQAMDEDRPAVLDLELLEMDARKIHAPKIVLPEGSERISLRFYEQYTVPYSQKRPDPVDLIEVTSLPKWMQPAFSVKTLNNVQSKVCNFALHDEGNMLVCAPTGAGKTTIALMAMLSCINMHRENGKIDLDAFKMIYISPLKALIQEQVREFSKRLAPFGISVAELSGDQTLSHDQLAQTQLIIATPEKWDVVTRKTSDISYTALSRLIILDEIHLLHDPRGPALESIVARTLKFSAETSQPVRLVGLSATLPNFKDVAHFLHVQKGLFSFDARYRPCPLTQVFIGVTEKKPLKAIAAMNDACWDKVQEYAGAEHQMIVFVHSRKDTFKTAQFLLNKAVEESKETLFKANEQVSCDNTDLSQLISKGVAVHHAGLSRADRSTVERLFAERKISVLVSTATLAWGVNLPAHAVIIKGTQIYNPQAGAWQELQPQDILQMLGRAGRPGFDRFGEGVVITQHTMLNYYLGISTANLPIESQLISRITDMMNAEVALGSLIDLSSAVEWLGRTYYYIRMLKDREHYRVGPEYDDDEHLIRRRRDLAHTAFTMLRKNGLIIYDGNAVKPTSLGKVSAEFYITPESTATYAQQLKPFLGLIDILRVFARSAEFKYIPVRMEERVELDRLVGLVPIPVKEPPTEPVAKMNVLLQAYICRLSLAGFALSSDMVYVAQSASRLVRAMFEIAVANKWAQLARQLLTLFKMVDRRMWLTSSPFRQFPDVPIDVIRKTEASMLPWERYFDLETAAELGQAIRSERQGDLVLQLLKQFPRFELEAMIQPLTHTMARVNVEITPIFDWNPSMHNRSERFWLVIDDGQDEILYSEWYTCRESTGTLVTSLPVFLSAPFPAHLFVSLISDRWLHSESTVAVDLRHTIMPSKFPAPTAVNIGDIKSVLADTDQSAYIGLAGPRLDLVKEVVSRHISEPGKIVVLYYHREQALASLKKCAFQNSGLLVDDLSVLAEIKVVFAWAVDFERLTRRWQRRRPLHLINVLVCEDTHMISASQGYLYELAILRTRCMTTQLNRPLRVVGLGLPTAPRELGQWLGASKSAVFNLPVAFNWDVIAFSPRVYKSQMLILARPVFEQVRLALEEGRRVLVWVSDYDQVAQTLRDFARLSAVSGFELPVPSEDFDKGSFFILPANSREAPSCDLSIIMNTESFDGNEDRFVSYTAASVVEMAACGSRALVYTSTNQKDYYTKFLAEPLPVESHISLALCDCFAVEISERVIQSAEEALDWLTYTYMFTRLRVNPSYFGLKDVTEDAVNEFLSELVESTFEELAESEMIDVEGEEMEVTPRNGAFIAAHYSLSTQTLGALSKLGNPLRLKSLLEKICSAQEMECVPLRSSDKRLLEKLAHQLPFRFSDESMSFAAKAFYLLQGYLSRVTLPRSYKADLTPVLDAALRLCKASIDLLGGDGQLSALTALDLHQMLVQGMWNKESVLKQIPHMTTEIINRCKDHEIFNVHDFMAIEDDELRCNLLGMTEEDPRMADIAEFVNRYPSIDITAQVSGSVVPGAPAQLSVVVERDVDESNLVIGKVPWPMRESWYVIVGSASRKELYGMKKTELMEERQTINVEFTLSEAIGRVTVWCTCDSYIDADKEINVDL